MARTGKRVGVGYSMLRVSTIVGSDTRATPSTSAWINHEIIAAQRVAMRALIFWNI